MPKIKLQEQILLTGIKQGAGKAAPVPFGSKNGNGRKKKSGKKKGQNGGVSKACWDAFNPSHLALPRAVAPYTVIRTTAIWDPGNDNQRRFALFGPSINTTADGGQWMSRYAVSANCPMLSPLNTTNGTAGWGFAGMNSSNGAWDAASVTPAAFSIQIMNPEALQTSTGMLYIGRCHNKVHLADGDLTRLWQDVANDLVSYSNPRLCSAGKIALRGVQVDGVPNNMSELSKFTSIDPVADGHFTLASTNHSHQEGFNPIFIYNPNAVNIQVLVCCEWRVRFDPSNPAYAACRAYKPSTDGQWWNHMNQAIAVGNGVIDIAERVAQLGKSVAPMLR